MEDLIVVVGHLDRGDAAGHATEGREGTVAETLDTGVIFTAEIRVSLSERGTPRVLLATSGTFTSSQGLGCLAGPASWCW
jgi:hypothetical protein